MKSIINHIAIITLLFSTASCKKSSDDAPPPRDPDKLRISRIAQSAIYSGGKTEIVISFVYDDQQRVDKIVSSQLHFSDTIQYFYNGSDQKPYKSNGTVPFYSWTGDTYYTYDRTGALIQDSIKSASTAGTNMLIRNYRYNPGKIIVKRAVYQTLSGGDIAFNETSDSISLNGSNIGEIMYQPESPFGTGNFYGCTYDDKINPISKLNIAVVKVLEGITTFPGHLAPGICKNNIIEYTSGTYSYGRPLVPFATKKLSFTYTREGLPETCVIENETDTHRFEYIYEEF